MGRVDQVPDSWSDGVTLWENTVSVTCVEIVKHSFFETDKT